MPIIIGSRGSVTRVTQYVAYYGSHQDKNRGAAHSIVSVILHISNYIYESFTTQWNKEENISFCSKAL